MKTQSMTSLIAQSVAVLAACAALNASAGTAKAPVPPVTEPGALFESLGATLDVGYDSRYYYRGLWFADNIVWSALNISAPLTEKLSLGVGATYISTAETPFPDSSTGLKSNSGFDYSEIDLVSSLSYNAGFAKLGVQYLHYFYPDTYAGSFNGSANGSTDPEFGIKGAGEVGLTAVIPLGAANIYLGGYYDFRVGGSYYQLGADYTVAVNDWLSLVPAVQTGYGIDYYTGNRSSLSNNVGLPLAGAPTSGFTHILVSVGAPMKLTKTATFTPYAAWNHSLDLRTGLNYTQHNEVFWGAKLSLAF